MSEQEPAPKRRRRKRVEIDDNEPQKKSRVRRLNFSNGDKATVRNGAERPANDTAKRDARGRFGAGNQAARGRRSRHHNVREAMHEKATPAKVAKVADRLLSQAINGDVQAAALVLSYVLGRPRPAPVEVGQGFELGSLSNLDQVREAAERIARAAADGSLGLDAAKHLSEQVRIVGEYALATEIGERIRELEALHRREA